MEVKVEENVYFPASTSNAVCNMCLSTDRKTCGVASVSYAYGLMTDWSPQDGARVCWECRALLARVLRFKVQALRAKEFLEAANVNIVGTDILSGKCLSQLSINKGFSLSASSPLPKNKPRKVRATQQKIKVVINTEEVWAEGLPDYDVKTSDEVQVPSEEDKAEEPMQKGRKARVKSEVKRTPKRKQVEKREKPKESIETFTVTMEDWNAYKETAFSSILLSSAFICKMCVEGFKYDVNFQKHNQKFHCEEAGSFVCDVCTSRFKFQELLTQHTSKHFQMYRCRYPGCSYAQHKKKNVQTHYFLHMQAEEVQRRERSNGDMFECDQCGKSFTIRRQLANHIRRHNKKHLCELCSYRCPDATQLKKHMLAHLDFSHRKFECEQCHKRFIDRQKMTYHIRTHTGERPFQCETCGTKFLGKKEMKRHIKLRHIKSGVKRTISQPRTKSLFNNNRPLIATISQGSRPLDERPFKCEICNASFKYKANLANHKLIHTGVKPHQCNICGASFAVKGNLTGHMKIHTNDRPYVCKVCGKKFAWNRNLNNHLKTHLK